MKYELDILRPSWFHLGISHSCDENMPYSLTGFKPDVLGKRLRRLMSEVLVSPCFSTNQVGTVFHILRVSLRELYVSEVLAAIALHMDLTSASELMPAPSPT